MKKFLLILIGLMPLLVLGQGADNTRFNVITMPNYSDSVSRINDTLISHNIRLIAILDSLAKQGDSLNEHNIRLLALIDSIRRHTDSLQAHNLRINEILDSLGNISTVEEDPIYAGDSIELIRWPDTTGNSKIATRWWNSQQGYVTGTPWTGMGYITDGNTNWDNSYGFITDGNTGWDNSYGFITQGGVPADSLAWKKGTESIYQRDTTDNVGIGTTIPTSPLHVKIVKGDATGGTITYAGGYTIHTFTSSGTFVTGSPKTVEVLVVGGGGGGGYSNNSSSYAGGGGSGGYRTSSSYSASGSISVTVGDGGNGGASPQTNGSSGGVSSFGTIEAAGGGGGGYVHLTGGVYTSGNGQNGGSGGGTGYYESGSPTAGSGNTPSTTPSQGNSGANYHSGGIGGGGGGSASTPVTGTGGSGTVNTITGSGVTYASGGNSYSASAGTDYEGDGGGGGYNSAGGKGGKGIVIVRYKTNSIAGVFEGNVGIGTTIPIAPLHVVSSYATGGTITYSGGYTIHTFTGDGTFTTPTSITASVLVVGGGGGGGTSINSNIGGGGGGGGDVQVSSAYGILAGSYPITVGIGGVKAASNSVKGTTGGTSTFGTLTAVGGGGGGSASTANGANGASGGGAAATGTGGTGTAGYNGGNGAVSSGYGSGGGGGDQQAGSNSAGSPTGDGGKGGEGYTSTISGASVVYGSGGGGGGGTSGTQGYGGTAGTNAGAGGRYNNNGTSAPSNYGGGGGGAGGDSRYAQYGGDGGSGVVIIRYLTPPSALFNGAVGIGTTAPTATLHAKGSTTNNSAYVFKAVNSTDANVFSLRNDGNCVLGSGTQDAQFTIGSTGSLSGIYSPAYASGSTSIINYKDWNGNARMTFDMSSGTYGALGINTTTPDEKLVVTIPSSTTGKYTSSGWTHSSDSTMKDSIRDIKNVLGKLKQLQGVKFVWKEDTAKWIIRIDTTGFKVTVKKDTIWKDSTYQVASGTNSVTTVTVKVIDKITEKNDTTYTTKTTKVKDPSFVKHKQLGFIAQSVEKVIPEAVRKGDDGKYSIADGQILPIVVEAAKEIAAEIDTLNDITLSTQIITPDSTGIKRSMLAKTMYVSLTKPVTTAAGTKQIANGKVDGQEITLVGMHNSNTLTIRDADNVNINTATVQLKKFQTITLLWAAPLNIWVEKSRSLN